MLKALLLTGSVVATLAGTRLLAQQDTTAASAAAVAEPVTIVVPATDDMTVQLPPNTRSTQVHLQPIPQVVQPQLRPLARSRSSR